MLLFHEKELSELMQSFYLLTGIKIALFDKEYNEILAYPNDRKTFCTHMRENAEFDRRCRACDNEYCRKCSETKSLHVYKCHAGLTEAVMPIMQGNSIIGYMAFGQVRDCKNRDNFDEHIKKVVLKYGVETDLEKSIRKITYKNNDQILAAATLLKACVEYIQIKGIVRSQERLLITKIERFIDEHISEDLTVERLCNEFHIKRTRLYEITAPFAEGGIASFIKKKRLEKARMLILDTDKKNPVIAYESGFSDYNYFLRIFKKEFGVSPKQLKKQKNKQE